MHCFYLVFQRLSSGVIPGVPGHGVSGVPGVPGGVPGVPGGFWIFRVGFRFLQTPAYSCCLLYTAVQRKPQIFIIFRNRLFVTVESNSQLN